jgi:hypothetical protein
VLVGFNVGRFSTLGILSGVGGAGQDIYASLLDDAWMQLGMSGDF